MTAALADVEGVSVSYGRQAALRSVTFSLGGKVTGLLGPNGAGKSTLMNVLTTRLAPKAGTVSVLGHDAATRAGRSQIRLGLGVLPQRVRLVRSMRVLDTVAYAAWTNGLSRSEAFEAAAWAVEAMGITDLAGRRAGRLSGGQRQRVGIAAAIAHRPALLVLDEPTVGLDPEFRLSLRGQLRMLAAESGMLISTHLADDASALCDRVLVLDAGELVFDGTPAALAEHAKANGEEFQAMGSPLERGYASLLAEHRRQAANRATQ